MKKPLPFEKTAKEKKSDKGMKEGSKADMLKDKMMMKKKMAFGGMAPAAGRSVLPKAQAASGGPSRSPRGAMTGGGKPAPGAMGGGRSMAAPVRTYTGDGKPLGAIGGKPKGMYRKGGMCK